MQEIPSRSLKKIFHRKIELQHWMCNGTIKLQRWKRKGTNKIATLGVKKNKCRSQFSPCILNMPFYLFHCKLGVAVLFESLQLNCCSLIYFVAHSMLQFYLFLWYAIEPILSVALFYWNKNLCKMFYNWVGLGSKKSE